MAKTGKRLKKAYEGIDPTAARPLEDALKLIKERASAKFDETVEVAMNLNLDPRKPDQNLRGAVMLPHGTGKTVRVAVFARGDRAKEAETAGADIVGAEDLAEKIQAGQINFDRAIATPDMMSLVGRLGKILGPRGLMPNPRLGTVTQNVTRRCRPPRVGKSSSAPKRPASSMPGSAKRALRTTRSSIMCAPLSAPSPGASRAGSRAPTSSG